MTANGGRKDGHDAGRGAFSVHEAAVLWRYVILARLSLLISMMLENEDEYPLLSQPVRIAVSDRLLQHYTAQMAYGFQQWMHYDFADLRDATHDDIVEAMLCEAACIVIVCSADHRVWLEAQELERLFAMKET